MADEDPVSFRATLRRAFEDVYRPLAVEREMKRVRADRIAAEFNGRSREAARLARVAKRVRRFLQRAASANQQ